MNRKALSPERINNVKTEIANLRNLCAARGREVVKLSDALDTARKDRDAANDDVSALRRKLIEVSAERDTLSQMVATPPR